MSKIGQFDKAIGMIVAASRALMRDDEDIEAPWRSLSPLRLALCAVADTFNILVSPTAPGHTSLFSGDEDAGPNIYTRLRFVRDLFSASSFALERAWQEMGGNVAELATNSDQGPSIEQWSQLVTGLNAAAAIHKIEELSRLLSDLFDAAVAMAREINSGAGIGREVDWGEIAREVNHIRDHFDYAEEFVLGCILPAD